MVRRIVAALAVLFMAWPAASRDLPGLTPIKGGNEDAYRVDLSSSKQPAGVYTIGKAFPMAVLDFEFGSSFSGILYACDEPAGATGSGFGADSNGDDDLSDESACVALATLSTADLTVDPLKAKKLWYVLDINTAGTATLTIKGTWQQVTSGGGSSVDADGDGLYEFAYLARDWDRDGTTWKTCDCGGTTTPGFTEGYLCGNYRASATDDTQTDYSAGDSADNPAVCRFHGERVWDDVTDDAAALRDLLAPGAVVYAERGIYDMKSTLAGASDECWSSTTETYSQTCKLDTDGTTYISGILLDKDNLSFEGAGSDSNGEEDLIRSGSWFVKDKGLERTWYTASGSTQSTIPAGFCVGAPRTAVQGFCGASILEQNQADVLLNVEMGFCIDSNGDGTCDNGAARTNLDVDTANVLCIDDSSGIATGMNPGEIWGLTTYTGDGGGLGRILMRVESVGADCGGSNTGQLVTFGNVQVLDDLSSLTYPQFVPYQVFGSESSDPGEAALASNVTGPVDMTRWTNGIRVSGITLAHQNYIGDGDCDTVTDAACDQSLLISWGSGSNHVFEGNAVVHTNSTFGSGGALNFEPYSLNSVVQFNTFRFNVGASLIDMSNTVTFRNNTVTDNSAMNYTISTSGSTSTRTHLIRIQGFWWKIEDNRFERNYLPLEYDSSIIEAKTPYGWIRGNVFHGTNATCVNIRPGAAHIEVSQNDFSCGAFIDDGGSDDDEFGFAVKIDGSTDSPSEAINIHDNHCVGGGRFTGSADAGEAIGNLCFQVKTGANSTSGEIAPMGIVFRDNFARLKSASDSALVGIRGCDDPDNANIFVDGNMLTTGRIAVCLGFPAGASKFLLDIGSNGGTSDDGVGLVTCGANNIGGTWYTSRIAGEGGRSNPSECAAAW